jgi:hypothetical protein
LDTNVDLSRRFVLGIRPEDLWISHGEGSVAGNGEIFFSEWRGEYQVVLVSAAGGTEHWLTLLAPEDVPFRLGDPVAVATDPRRVHLFDAETERNVLLDLSEDHPLPQGEAVQAGGRASA